MSDIENETDKTERLGIVPAEKIPTVVGAKVWAEHRKNLAALAAAKPTAAANFQAAGAPPYRTRQVGGLVLMNRGAGLIG